MNRRLFNRRCVSIAIQRQKIKCQTTGIFWLGLHASCANQGIRSPHLKQREGHFITLMAGQMSSGYAYRVEAIGSLSHSKYPHSIKICCRPSHRATFLDTDFQDNVQLCWLGLKTVQVGSEFVLLQLSNMKKILPS